MGKKATLRQQEIINSARRIIIARGVEYLTTREIAKDLQITDGALYRHFKSKKEIISLLIDDIETTLLATISEAAQQSKDPLERLKSIFLSHFSYVEQRKGVSFIVINQTLGLKDKALQKKAFSVVNQYLEMIKSILKEGINAGDFKKGINLDSAGVIFLGMVQSRVMLWALSGFRDKLQKDHLEKMFDVYEKGIIVK